LQIVIVVNIVANLIGFYEISLKGTQLISFTYIIIVILMAANSYKNGYKLAKFFLIGWGLFLSTLLIFSLAIIKLLPFSLFIMQLPQFGLSLELFWLSFFLGHSFNVLKKEKNELQKKSLDIITAKKEELEIIVSERTMDLLNSNQIKDKILASISHDLRMPLVNTLGILELMENGLIKPKESKLKITQVKLSIVEIANTMHNLIKWSAVQLGQYKPNPELVDLSEMLGETLKLYTLSIIQKSIQVTINCHFARVLIDREQLKIILRNLIDNAVKYNNQEGKVHIDCYQRPDQPTLVMVSVSNSHPYSHENLAPLFEEGKIIHPSTGNGLQYSGLGLHLCRDFLAINGSKLIVEIKNGLWVSSFELPVPAPANH
jgi:signal transduction histidine kinase